MSNRHGGETRELWRELAQALGSVDVHHIIVDAASNDQYKRPYDAFNVPITRRDLGRGVLGNSDDGAASRLYTRKPGTRRSFVNRPA